MKILAPFSILTLLLVSFAAVPPNRAVSHVPRSMIQTSSIYPGGEKQMRCSGFVVDAVRGFAVTAEHCVVDGQIAFLVDDLPSEVVRTSEWLALVRVPTMTKPPLEIAKKRPDLSAPTWGFGWAFGQKFLALERAVAGYDGTDLVVGGAFIEGMSGGPVVNDQGQVVGVIQGGVPAAAWLSGPDEIREFLKEM